MHIVSRILDSNSQLYSPSRAIQSLNYSSVNLQRQEETYTMLSFSTLLARSCPPVISTTTTSPPQNCISLHRTPVWKIHTHGENQGDFSPLTSQPNHVWRDHGGISKPLHIDLLVTHNHSTPRLLTALLWEIARPADELPSMLSSVVGPG